MRKYELNKLCVDETDPMINAEAMNCNYFRWRDLERVDERSKFILLRLVNKINELEKNYDSVKMQLNKLESLKTQRHNPINMNLDDLHPLEGLKPMSPDTTADFITCLGPADTILLLGSLGYEKKFGGVAKSAPTDETSSACVALPLEFDGVVKSAPTDGTSSAFVDLPLEFDGVAKSVPTDGTGAFLGLPLSLFAAGSSSVFVCF
ncbi:hypothetical protein FXO38_09291 [Capsicum annuum]|nr:hypothetical protein FXO38_09291 [Capsicum annuum]